MFKSCLTRAAALVSRPARLAALAFICALALIAIPTSAQAQADLVVNSHTDSPDPGPAGGVFTYTIGIANNAGSTAANVVVTDTLDVGATFVSLTTSLGTCDAAPVGVTIQCALGSLPVNGTATVTLKVIYAAAGFYTNTASVTSTTPDPNTNNNTLIQQTTVQNAANMSLTVTDAPDPVNAGAAFTYTLTATNNGPQALSAGDTATISFAIPAGACITSNPNGSGGWSCSIAPPGAYPRCSGTITCTHAGPLASGASEPALVVNAASGTGVTAGAITGAFQVSSNLPDGNPADNTATATTTINSGFSDVSITKARAPATVAVGSNVTFTLTPRFNGGEAPGTAPPNLITVTDSLAAGLTFVSATGSGWLCSFVDPVVTCTRGPYNGNNFTDMPQITIVATVTAVGPILNSATIAAPETDPNPANNTSNTVTVTGSNDADLSLVKTATLNPVVPNQAFSFVLSVHNNGPVPVAAGQTITVTDSIPAGITVTSLPTGGGFSCTPSGGYPLAGPFVLTCTRTGALASGSTAAITVPAVTTIGGSIPNTACAALSVPGPADPNAGNDCGSQTIISTLSGVAANLAVTSKTASPPTVKAGQDLTYTVNVTNLGPSPSTNVTVTDVLGNLVVPGGFQSAVAANGGTCAPNTATNGPAVTLTCNLGTLASGESTFITVVVRPSIAVSGVNNRSNTATITSPDVGDPDLTNNSASVTSSVTAIADLTLTKTDTPDPAQAGTPLTYVMTAHNSGPSIASSVTLTDTLPANTAYISLTTTGTLAGPCTEPAVGSSGGLLSCTWTSIVAGGQQTATVKVRPLTGVTVVNNTAHVDTTTEESDTTNNDAAATTAVTTAAIDLLINKSDNPDPVPLNAITTYTVTVNNAGPSYATNVVMTDTFPTGSPSATFSYQGSLTISSPTGGGCVEPALNATAGSLVCTFPGLDNGQSAIVTYQMRAEAIASGISGTTFNTASVTATEPESQLVNNTTTETTTSRRTADLALTKTAPASVTPGTTVTWTLTITNNGPNPSTGALVTDVLPAGVTFQSASAGCAFATGTVTCTLGTLAPLASTSFTITALVSKPYTGANPLVNSAVVAAVNEADPVPGNNPGSGSSTVDLSPTLAKSIQPGTITPGGVATLTLTLGNPNAAAQTLASNFTDPMPAGVTTTSANTGTCTGVVVTSTLITMAAGTTIAGGGCTIVVTITSSTQGTAVNTTSPLVTNGGTAPPASAPLIVVSSGPSLFKSIVPATITAGGTATLTLTLGNVDPLPLVLTVPFVDNLPAGMTIIGANTGTCPGVLATASGILMSTGSAIPPGGCTIVVPVTSTTPGTLLNTTGALSTSGGGTPTASAPLTVIATTGATLTKTIAPASIAPGGIATLTLALGNSNATPLILTAAFTDAMPAGVTTTSGNTGTCGGVTVTSTLITMASGATIPPGGCTIVVTITSSTPGTVTNTTSPLVTGGGTTPPASAPLTVSGTITADLAITKTNNVTTVTPGSVVTYTIVVTNNGPGAVTGATVTDVVPAALTGVTWTCVASAGSACPASGAGNINAAVDLLAGGTATFTLKGTLSASATGTLTNTATVAAPPGITDPVPGNNSATDSDPVAVPVIDLAIVKTHLGTFAPGQVGAQYAITVTNVGSVASVGTVTVTETPPAGLTVTAMAGAGWSCVQPAGPCSRSDPLAPGASYPVITVTVTVAANPPSPLVNVAAVAGGGDVNGANNSAKDSIFFAAAPGPDAAPIPVDSRLALGLLAAFLGLLGAARLRRAR